MLYFEQCTGSDARSFQAVTNVYTHHTSTQCVCVCVCVVLINSPHLRMTSLELCVRLAAVWRPERGGGGISAVKLAPSAAKNSAWGETLAVLEETRESTRGAGWPVIIVHRQAGDILAEMGGLSVKMELSVIFWWYETSLVLECSFKPIYRSKSRSRKVWPNQRHSAKIQGWIVADRVTKLVGWSPSIPKREREAGGADLNGLLNKYFQIILYTYIHGDRQTEIELCHPAHSPTDKWMDGWIIGWMDGWMDGE